VTPAGVFDTARETMAGKLTAELPPEVPATLDPSASPPFVLVDLPRVDGAVGVGGWSTQLRVVIAVPPPGDYAASVQLLALLEIVFRTLGCVPADPFLYTTNAGKDLPAYELAYRVDIDNPDC
jgi:hypothetical protein